MTIEEYIQGSFEQGAFSDNNIAYALAKYGIQSHSDISNVGERERDLAVAELHLIFANRANGSGEEIVRGDFKISERSWNMTLADREYHRNVAARLFRKWGVDSDDIIDEERHYTIGDRLL